MKTFITKSILTAALLIIGLSVSAERYALEYEFGSGYESVLPSKQMIAADANIFSSPGNDIGRPQRGFGDDGDDPFDPGGGTDPDDGYNDAPVGSGMYVLMLLAVAYGGYLFRRKKVLTA